jgi:hypothetical protein
MPFMLGFGGGEISSHQRQLCTEQVHDDNVRRKAARALDWL